MSTSRGADNKETLHGERDSDGVTVLQAYYLKDLERLIGIQATYQADPGGEEWLLTAINKAVYSAFRSCSEHGAGEEAKALLASARQSD